MADDHDLDLGPAIREALLGESGVADLLSTWTGEPAVFTRRPVPADATDPMIIVNPPRSVTDADGLTSDRPVWMGDVAIYGRRGAPGDPTEDDTRVVEQIGIRIRALFHRQRFALQVGGFHVIDIRAAGPVPAPVDDDKTVGRIVSLIVRLRRGS